VLTYSIVRSDSLASAERLWQRVKKCWDAAALATGCTVKYEPINSYADVRSSSVICKEFCSTMDTYGHEVSFDDPADFLAGSTDMGNVTYECPGFHGSFGIDTEVGQGNHTEGFTKAAGLEKSFDRNMDWSKGMARVGWKVLVDDEFATRMKEDWEEDMKRAKT
jgi:metal-dependent amidase/aminoacylase/carboxypeptidase family protein